MEPVCTASVSPTVSNGIRTIHQQSRHPGVKRMLYFVRRINPAVSEVAVRNIVRECKEFQSIDPLALSEDGHHPP